MIYAYALLDSSEESQTTPKLDFLNVFEIDQIVTDYKGFGLENRRKMLKELRSGDTLYLRSFSACTEDEKDREAFVRQLDRCGIHYVCFEEHLDSACEAYPFMIRRLLYGEEEEEPVKKEDPRRGRHAKHIDMELLGKLYDRMVKKEITKKEMMVMLDVSFPTLAKLIREYESGSAY